MHAGVRGEEKGKKGDEHVSRKSSQGFGLICGDGRDVLSGSRRGRDLEHLREEFQS